MKHTLLQSSAVRALAQWFEKNHRAMPWRQDPTPYKVWISEIMLAQTQVITVIPYFNRFLSRFPNLESLAAATQEEVNQLWAGLGYYTRARNILKAAQNAHAQGGLPETHAEWLEMPGIGPYTAGAICSIALNLPTALVDGNVERVFSRLFQLKRDKDFSEKNWAIANELIAKSNALKIKPRTWNQALMELGATVCTPSKPACPICPLQKDCLAFQNKTTDAFPQPKPKKAWKAISESVDIYWDKPSDSVFLSKEHSQWRKDLWDFPQSENQPRPKSKPLAQFDVKLVVTHHKIKRTHWIYEGRPNPHPQNGQWFTLEALIEQPVAIGAPIKKSLRPLLKELRK